MGKRTALIVGINDYEDPSFERLKYAETDAQAVYNVLIDPDICEFDKENVLLLTGETKSQLERSLEGLLNDAKPDDFVFIYFAGHGKLDRSGSLCLAAKDTLTTRLLSSSVSLEHVRRIIDQSDCKRIVFILDSCFSGAVGQTFRSGEVPTESIEQISGQGKVMISASQAYERARERDDIGHGIFTYNLVRGLREGEADFGSDGYITIEDIYKYVYENVKAETKGQQVPMKWGVDEKGEIIVAKSVKVLREKRQALERKIESAQDLEKDGKLGEALSAWAEAAVMDPENNEVNENKARIKGIISNIDGLFIYFDKKGLPGPIYNDAVEILKKPEATLTEREESYRRLVENLLNESLSLQIFLDSWKRIERADIVIGSKDEGSGDSVKAPFLGERSEEAPVVYEADFVDESEIVGKEKPDTKPSPDEESIKKPDSGTDINVIGQVEPPKEVKEGSINKTVAIVVAVLVLALIGVIVSQMRTDNRSTETVEKLPAELPAPEILSFSASPEIIKPGGSATLKWDTSNAEQVRIEPLGKVKASGSKNVSPSENTSYKLTAENKEGEIAFKTLTVKVESAAPLPQISHFRADSDTISSGESVVLTWGTSNASSVEIKPLGRVEPRGSIRTAPVKTTTYTLTAKNSEGKSVTDTFRVNVAAKPADKMRTVAQTPKINYFRTNANSLKKGSSFILSWETQGADEVQITGIGNVKQSGYISLKATETNTYTLTAKTKDGGKAESALTITVVDEAENEGEPPKIQYEDYTPVIPEAVRRQLEKKE